MVFIPTCEKVIYNTELEVKVGLQQWTRGEACRNKRLQAVLLLCAGR